MSGWGAATLAAIALALAPAVARADACPSPAGADTTLAQRTPAERYLYLERSMAREAHSGRVWNRVWGFGLLGTAAGQVGIGLLVADDGCPTCWYVGAGKALLGSGSTFLLDRIRARELPALTTPPTCAQLALAEAALAETARRARVHWSSHVEGWAVNLAASLYMALELDAWDKAGLSLATGLVVGELRLYTRPDAAIGAVRRYRAGELGTTTAAARSWMIAPLIADDAYGLSLAFEL